MKAEEWPRVKEIAAQCTNAVVLFDGAPCAMKVARTVRVRGKDRDNIKVLPIDIKVVFEGNTLTVEKNPLEHADRATRY